MIKKGRKREREGVGGRARWELVFYLREATGEEAVGVGVMGEADSLAVWDGKTGTGVRDRNLCGACFGLGAWGGA